MTILWIVNHFEIKNSFKSDQLIQIKNSFKLDELIQCKNSFKSDQLIQFDNLKKFKFSFVIKGSKE